MSRPSHSREPVIVLGAGLQGACVALALARQGHAVTLVDEAPDCLTRASLVNEGKIHLGHVYANDPTFETPRLMLRAALCFGPLLERWLGRAVPWSAMCSTPFVYPIARDSQVTVEQLLAHYERLDVEYQQRRRDGEGPYLGDQPAALWERIDVPAALDPEFVSAAVATPEVAISPPQLREMVGAALRATNCIETLYGHRADWVRRVAASFEVGGTNAIGATWHRHAALVVNCLWTGRLRMDQHMGLLPQRSWVYRLKYRVIVELPDRLAQLPSLTVVLGRYGDIVTTSGERTA